jgi:cell division protein FtsI (penicillin-binding protein 3)
MSIRRNILLRVYLAFGLILFLAGAVAVQLCRLQFVQGKKWRGMATKLSTKYEVIPAARGNILAVDGSLLATSVPEYDVHMDMLAGGLHDDKLFYSKVDSLALKLSQLFPDKSEREYSRLLRDGRRDSSRYVLIHHRVSYQDLKKVRMLPLFNLGGTRGGLVLSEQNNRVHPYKSLAVRTLGYKNENVKNGVGLEGAYVNYINGENGRRLVQRVAGGAYIAVNGDEDETPAKEGADIISTIDVNYQDIAQRVLKAQLDSTQADYGCVVLMEVATGEIRAIANFTKKGEHDYEEELNYAISNAIDPGSTFKLASYMTMFDQHKIDTNTLVDANNGRYDMLYKGKLLKTFRDAEQGNYVMTAKRAFEESSNVAVVKFVSSHYQDNPREFTNNLRNNLHLNDKLDLQIPGEAHPLVKDPSARSWSKLTLPQMAYGYEMKITPLQMLTLYNGVANNGELIAPIFVKEIQRAGNTVEQFHARVINPKMCSDETLGKMKAMLEGVVTEGTGKLIIKNPLYAVAGKTGTAQIANGSTGYGVTKTYQASFCGYFPANHPKYSMIVVINHPTRGNYLAAYVAGPVFRKIADRIYASDVTLNHNAPQPTHYVGNTTPPVVKKGDVKALHQVYSMLNIKTLYASNNPSPVGIDTTNGIAAEQTEFKKGAVPSVIGMDLSDALYILGNSGYKVVAHGSGAVTSQSVTGGSLIPKGAKITIELQ